MYKIEVKVKDELTDKTRYINYDYCNLENLDGLMHEMTKYIRRELKFTELYAKIATMQRALDASNITHETLFLSPEAADYLHHEYGWLCGQEKGRIAKFMGLTVIIVPDLDKDFFIGVNNG